MKKSFPNYIYSTLFCISFLISGNTFAFWEIFGSRCDEFAWTKEDGRTQGGGWVWFPGQGAGVDRETALLMAEGNALTRLVQECQFTHKEVKAHERCVEEVSGTVKAYVRFSLLDQQCRETKYAGEDKKSKLENKELSNTLERYRRVTNQYVEKPVLGCEEKGPTNCYDNGKYEYFMGDHKKAALFFDLGCKNGHQPSCFNAGMVAWEMGDSEKAAKYLELQCHQNDYQACHFLADLTIKDNAEKARKSYEKACDNNWGDSCVSLTEILMAEKNANHEVIEKLFAKACTLKAKNACHKTSVYYFDKGSKIEAQKFAEEACHQGWPKSCFNLAMIFELEKSVKKKDYLKSACDKKLGIACFELSKLVPVHDKEKLLSKGCDFGEGKSCADLSIALYDSKKLDQSLFYSKCACKLGVFKSCHNAGYFEFQKGDKDEAKIHLASACDNGIGESCKLLKDLK